ncbi:hypothetical protein B0J18DRAFT_62838 [Chaetomium sp. MPI-SDFR-AT-0129]|nr:hypothetical protein B0J18DRAFT_62838 [Chaetomium sp. MPI-SDFR-AT-0129]
MACVVVPDTTHTSLSASPSPSPSPSASPLLRLTPDIRLRLYRYLGLASWDGRHYQFDLRGGRARRRRWVDYPPDPIDFYGLLISCRTIYTEAAALLYSANTFVVHHYAPGQLPGLHALGTLTEPSLRSLSRLKIVLCEAACHNRVTKYDYSGNCCCQGHEVDSAWSDLQWCRKRHCNDIHQPPLLSDADGCMTISATADDVQRAWHSATTQLFARITPGRLALSLVCDIAPQHPLALPLAESILEPLLLLPRSYLAGCQIRLAKTPDGGPLQKLAQDTVIYTCGLLTPVPYARAPSSEQAEQRLTTATPTATLASLPRELRVHILEYTDLITPRKQVAWSRQDRAYVLLRLGREEEYDNQFFECFRRRPEGCFCRRRHTAFSSDSHCTCWAPPGPSLFLVCRTLSQDAQYVFFSRNRFIIHDYQTCGPWQVPNSSEGSPQPSYPFDRLAASEFLHDVVPASALGHIRFLELVFPPYLPATWPGPNDPATQDWHATVAWLRHRHRLQLPALTLRMMVMDESNGATDREVEVTTEEAKTVLMAYFHVLVSPLRELAAEPLGLARFYASFRYPQPRPRRPPPPIPRGPWYDPWLKKRDLNQRLERYVMGARYENMYVEGRTEPRPSDWDHMSFDWREGEIVDVEPEDLPPL